MQKERLTPFGIIALAIVCIGGLLFGYHTGIIAGALIFLAPIFQFSAYEEGVLVSIMLVGALAGSLVAGFLADFLGRKKGMICMACLFIVGTLILSIAATYPQLLIGRILCGLGLGLASVICPLYLAEIAPPDSRGRCVSAFQLSIALGVLFSYAIIFIFSPQQQWRMLFFVGFFPAFIQLCALFLIPETPSWLFSHHKFQYARRVLKRLRRDNLWTNVQEQKTSQSSEWKAFFKPQVRYVVILGLILSILQQITGINGVIYYAPKIFQIAGFDSGGISFLATLSLGIINFLITFFSMWILDRIGRRKLLLIGSLGMMLSLGLLAYGFFAQTNHKIFLTLFSLLAYIACFALSFGPVTWVLLSEIFPLKIRGNALGLALALNWVANYVISLIFPNLIYHLGGCITFGLFSAISLVAFMFVFYCIPETKGKSLEEIESMIARGRF